MAKTEDVTMEATKGEIDAANAYEGLHVPALFQQWAPEIARITKVKSGHHILDVACGTGVLARQLLSVVGEQGAVVGLDANLGMLAVASRLSPTIDWQHGIAEALPFKENSFDSVVCQFGLMFFQDRAAALHEMIRVLVPAGGLSVTVWDSLENSNAYREEVALLRQLAGPEAADALQAPFVLGRQDELSTLFDDIGLDEVLIETHHGVAHFPSVRVMVEADLRGWLPLMGVNLSEELIETILRQSEDVLARYVATDGTVEFDAPAHIVSGRRKV